MQKFKSTSLFALALLTLAATLFAGGLLAAGSCCHGMLPVSCGGDGVTRFYGSGFTSGLCFSTVRDDFGNVCATSWVDTNCY